IDMGRQLDPVIPQLGRDAWEVEEGMRRMERRGVVGDSHRGAGAVRAAQEPAARVAAGAVEDRTSRWTGRVTVSVAAGSPPSRPSSSATAQRPIDAVAWAIVVSGGSANAAR